MHNILPALFCCRSKLMKEFWVMKLQFNNTPYCTYFILVKVDQIHLIIFSRKCNVIIQVTFYIKKNHTLAWQFGLKFFDKKFSNYISYKKENWELLGIQLENRSGIKNSYEHKTQGALVSGNYRILFCT